MKRIVIIDYGVGNLGSVLKAVRRFAPDAIISEEREVLETADALILPGVGAFAAGMEGLHVRGLTDVVRKAALRGVPILGICLGAQLLLEEGEEGGHHVGLGILPGKVTAFAGLPEAAKIPVIGWQETKVAPSAEALSLFRDIKTPSFYFVHSYILKPTEPSLILATATYAGVEYAAAIGKGVVFGTQFHPEKSGEAGLALIQHFIELVASR